MQDHTRRAMAFAIALAAFPLAAGAQSPRPSPAITGTQAGINKAQQRQLAAQKKTKSDASQRVNSGGAHADSESPDKPGSSQHKPMSGPGYAGGVPSSAPPK